VVEVVDAEAIGDELACAHALFPEAPYLCRLEPKYIPGFPLGQAAREKPEGARSQCLWGAASKSQSARLTVGLTTCYITPWIAWIDIAFA
jgi:hypothetical protein